MIASDRSSDRVVESPTSDLVRSPASTVRGADDVRQSVTSSTSGRVGVRRLAELRTALSSRQSAILHSLDSLHFLTSRQVERLHYPASTFTALSAARSSRRDLAALNNLALVRHLDRRIGGIRAGSASYVWTLDSLGARLLGVSSRRRASEPSRLHLEHVLAVAELVVQLHEEAARDEIELVAIETEPTCWRVLPAPHGGRLTLKPDLRLTLGVGEHELHWFIEVDRGSEHRPVLARKCRAYLSAWTAGREQSLHGVFPRVLWVVPDAGRTAVIGSVIARLAGAPTGMFVTATTEDALAALKDSGGAP